MYSLPTARLLKSGQSKIEGSSRSCVKACEVNQAGLSDFLNSTHSSCVATPSNTHDHLSKLAGAPLSQQKTNRIPEYDQSDSRPPLFFR